MSIHQITPHVYWLPANPETDRPLLGVVAGARASLIVDAGNSPAHAGLLLDELARLPVPAPAFLALTHWHWDHVFGAATFNLPTFASLETCRIVSEMARQDWSDAALDQRVRDGLEIEFCQVNIKKELPERGGLVIRPPEIGFSDRVEVDLGGITCQLVHVGGDHSGDSSVVYVPEEQVLFLGDCAYQNLYAPRPCYTTARLFPLLDTLLGFAAGFYLEAHAPQPATRLEFEKWAQEQRLIGRAVQQAGPQRAAALADAEARLGGALNEEQVEALDAFLAGQAG